MSDTIVNVRGREVTVADISGQFRNAAQSIEHAIGVLEGHLERFSNWRSVRVSPRHEELRRDLPYYIHGVDAKGRYILVNRDYKPLGVPSSDWADYEQYPHMHVALTEAQIKAVVHPKHERGLFGDGSTPWSRKSEAHAYLERLTQLLAIIRDR